MIEKKHLRLAPAAELSPEVVAEHERCAGAALSCWTWDGGEACVSRYMVTIRDDARCPVPRTIPTSSSVTGAMRAVGIEPSLYNVDPMKCGALVRLRTSADIPLECAIDLERVYRANLERVADWDEADGGGYASGPTNAVAAAIVVYCAKLEGIDVRIEELT
jgi:hypothetical protein